VKRLLATRHATRELLTTQRKSCIPLAASGVGHLELATYMDEMATAGKPSLGCVAFADRWADPEALHKAVCGLYHKVFQ
jgi:hypothetical protein